MATAIVQLFFLASASAGAATFLALSRLMDMPYGIANCAIANVGHNTKSRATKALNTDCSDILVSPLNQFYKPADLLRSNGSNCSLAGTWEPGPAAVGPNG